MKKVYVTNGSAENGKDTFAELLGKYISVYKYSSIDLVKEMFEVVGVNRENKTEKKRKLWKNPMFYGTIISKLTQSRVLRSKL